MTQCHPVSPLPIVCMPGSPGITDGGEDLELVDENVDADQVAAEKHPVVR